MHDQQATGYPHISVVLSDAERETLRAEVERHYQELAEGFDAHINESGAHEYDRRPWRHHLQDWVVVNSLFNTLRYGSADEPHDIAPEVQWWATDIARQHLADPEPDEPLVAALLRLTVGL